MLEFIYDWWCWWKANGESARNFVLTVAAIVGALLLAWRTWSANRAASAAVKQAKAANDQASTAADRHIEQTKADAERRITESFAKASEQISSNKCDVVLGGIYTFERLSREGWQEYWPAMEILSAFIRRNAPRNACLENIDPLVQATLTVIARRMDPSKDDWRRIDLRSCSLKGASLRKAKLMLANLDNTDLTEAVLIHANLEEASLSEAILLGAILDCANLREADLQGADLRNARLLGVNLQGAYIENADLSYANLTAAKGLTQEQVMSARGNWRTVLPTGFDTPIEWLSVRN